MASLAVTLVEAVKDRIVAAMQAGTFSRTCPVERRYFRSEMLEDLTNSKEQIWVGHNAREFERLTRASRHRKHNYIVGIAYLNKLQSYGNSDLDPLDQFIEDLTDWFWHPDNITFTSGGTTFVFNDATNNPAYQQDLLDQDGVYAAVILATFTFGRAEP